MKIRTFVAVCLFVFATTAVSSAQCVDFEFPIAQHYFPAIDGDVLVLPRYDSSTGIRCRIYRRTACDDWDFEQQITVPTFDVVRVAVQGDLIAIGNTEASSIGLYRRNPSTGHWSLESTLTTSEDLPEEAKFGWRIRIDDDLVIVSSFKPVSTILGRVHIFRRNASTGDWNEEQILTNPITTEETGFGQSIDVDNGRIVVGAWFEDDTCSEVETCNNSGAAYIYTYNGSTMQWEILQKLTPPMSSFQVLFGGSVAIENDIVAVYSGLHLLCGTGICVGAYVYRQSEGEWLFEETLAASEYRSYYVYSRRQVEISNGSILISGSASDEPFAPASLASLFAHNGSNWEMQEQLHAEGEPGLLGNLVAVPIALSGDVALLSVAVTADELRLDLEAFCVNQPFDDCNNDFVRDGCQLLDNDLNGNSRPDDCEIARGDVNLDEIVDAQDLLLVLASWGICAPICAGDTNVDGVVNVVDLLTVLANWGSVP